MQLLHLGFFKKLNLNSLLSQKKGHPKISGWPLCYY